jgi:hypothetical protein
MTCGGMLHDLRGWKLLCEYDVAMYVFISPLSGCLQCSFFVSLPIHNPPYTHVCLELHPLLYPQRSHWFEKVMLYNNHVHECVQVTLYQH